MMFAQNEYWLYVQRFLLGSCEVGLVPGVLYLSFWFPNHCRGRATSLLPVGISLSGLIGRAIAGAIMEGMDGLWGIRGLSPFMRLRFRACANSLNCSGHQTENALTK